MHTPITQPGGNHVLDTDTRNYNALLRGLRCLGERGFAALTGRRHTLRRITARPRKIATIDQAALVLTHIEHGTITQHSQLRSPQSVEGQPRRSSGPMLTVCFAVMYYAALRPEEAAMLRKQNLQLPERGWGELLLSETAPITGGSWTGSGERRDRRQLKQRGRGEVRHVPSLTAVLHEHLSASGTAGDGRLFRNLTVGDLAESTVGSVWDKARKAALSAAEYASPLARRPYDLRHACDSTWLGSGASSTQCAEWAGHSVAVLYQVYAKVIADQEDSTRRRIVRALECDDPTDDECDGGERDRE